MQTLTLNPSEIAVLSRLDKTLQPYSTDNEFEPLKNLEQDPTLTLEQFNTLFNATTCIYQKENTPKSLKKQLAEDQRRLTELFHRNLQANYPNAKPFVDTQPQEYSLHKKRALGFLLMAVAFCGAIWAGLDAFDGITSLLGVFFSVKAALLFPGLIFSLLGIFIYYCFDLKKISQAMDLNILDIKSVINDFCIQQSLLTNCHDILNMTIEHIQNSNSNTKDKLTQLESLTTIQNTMKFIGNDLTVKKSEIKKNLDNPSRMQQFAKNALSISAASIFASSGYFVGNLGAIKLILLLSVFGLSLSNPVTTGIAIAVGVICILGAYASYDVLQKRLMYEKIDEFLGHPAERVKTFLSHALQTIQETTEKKLDHAIKQITQSFSQEEKISKLKQKNSELKQKVILKEEISELNPKIQRMKLPKGITENKASFFYSTTSTHHTLDPITSTSRIDLRPYQSFTV